MKNKKTPNSILMTLASLIVAITCHSSLLGAPRGDVKVGFAPVPLSEQPKDCRLDSTDPFDPATYRQAKFLKGPNKGECLETRTKRSIRILTPLERKQYGITADDTRLVVANFSHLQRYWIALIPTNKIKNVIYQVEYFPAVIPAAHNQLRFDFEKASPIILIPQKNPQGPRRHILHFAYSNEAILKLSGDSFDVWKGLWKHYGLSHRFVSLSDQYRAMVINQSHRIEQIALKLSKSDQTNLLLQAAQISHQEGTTKLYHTLGKSCGTEILRVLDESRPFQWHLLPKKIVSTLTLSEALTTEVKRALWSRNLLTKKPLPDLDQDLEFLSDYSHESLD